jgi:hypothetical protein
MTNHAATTMMNPSSSGVRTTLGGAVGQSMQRARGRSKGLWIGIAAIVVLVGVGITAKLASSDDPATRPAASAPAAPSAAPESVKVEPLKVEPAKVEPEPVKAEPLKTEPVKAEPVKVEPAPAKPVDKKPTKPVRPKPKTTKPNDLYDDRG